MSQARELDLHSPAKPPAEAAVVDGDALMAVIARAAADPNTDVDKLERLMAMAERREAMHAKTAYFAAMAEMQDELPIVSERGEIKIRDDKPGQKYALFEDINRAIKPVLKKYGFALSFRIGQADNKFSVTGVLSHAEGHSEETTMHLPIDTSGSKNAVQAVGSSASYGRRYTTIALLNLSSTGDDDDGRTAGGGTVTDDQLEKLSIQFERTGSDTDKFCEFFKISALPDLLQKDFGTAMQMLNSKPSKKK